MQEKEHDNPKYGHWNHSAWIKNRDHCMPNIRCTWCLPKQKHGPALTLLLFQNSYLYPPSLA